MGPIKKSYIAKFPNVSRMMVYKVAWCLAVRETFKDCPRKGKPRVVNTRAIKSIGE